MKLFLATIAMFFSTLLSINANKPTIKIFCKIKNQVDTNVRFSYFEGIYQPTEVEKNKLIDKKEVSFLVQTDAPILIRVEHDYRYFELYCEPNDSIVMDFDAEIYPTEIAFSGRGALHNKLLHQYRQAFLPLSNKVITRSMNTMPGLQFRKYMDKHYADKWDFVNKLPKEEVEKCSAQFRQFWYADIEYWYAFYLMRYYDAHLSLVDDESIYLPDAYFDFLNELIINNETAFVNPFYCKFAKLYYEFRKNAPDFPYGLAARQILVKSNSGNIPLYSGIDCAKEIGKVNASDVLLVLDKITANSKKTEVQLAYRLKIKTQDNRVGWVKANHCEELNTAKLLNTKPLYVNSIEVNYDKDVVDGFASLDSLGLFGDPNEKSKMYRFNKGETLDYYDESTMSLETYVHEGQYMSSTFTKVQNKYGIIGWVPSAGIKLHYLKRAASEWKSRVAEKSETPYHNLDYFFYGKGLDYALGMDLRNNLWYYGKEKTTEDLKFFAVNCKDENLKKEMLALYAKEDKRFTVMDSVGSKRTIIVLDSRSTSLNKRTNNFELPKDEASADLAMAKAKTALENRKNKKKGQVELLAEPTFPEVDYEYRSVVIRGNKKLLKKYVPQINLQADLVNEITKRQPFSIQKGRKIWYPDTFTYKINIVEPIRGTFISKTDSMPLWLEPGQTYTLKDMGKKLAWVGEGTSAFEYSKIQHKLNNDIEIATQAKVNLPFEAFNLFLKDQLELKRKALDDFKKNSKLSYNFSKTVEFDNDYWYYTHLMKYAERNPDKIGAREDYFTFLKDVKLQNSRALLAPEYLAFVHSFLKYNMEVNKHLALPEKEVARLTYSNRVLKYWQAYDIVRNVSSKGVEDDVLTEMQKFFDDSSFPIINESVKNAYLAQTLKKEGYKAPSFSVINYANNQVELADMKGKVILVHFWNSSQKDYAKKFKQLKTWEDKLKSKDVVILKVNTDASPVIWRSKVRKYRKDKYHVYLNDQNTYLKNINDYFEVKDKPYHIVISKKGTFAKDVGTEIKETELLNFIRSELNKR